jgi:hypothetical protein
MTVMSRTVTPNNTSPFGLVKLLIGDMSMQLPVDNSIANKILHEPENVRKIALYEANDNGATIFGQSNTFFQIC